MSYYVYILYSDAISRYYIGSTQDLDNRITEHNSGETKSIKHGIPWRIVWSQKFETKSDAIKMEIKIKKRGAKRFLLEQIA
ncbi:GIY-YIG nuclease family protein [Pseudochryseolinea flava]|uniref:GIY-YIG nuclease family protein n=1 Tax=Pseudochryseolinea flava TaxID=2059302 RepID=A0A364XYC2_9BACT|nr:GIY-YIG nuclease family protein [Pseudochryseolinea flava]RAV99499.1 GIY-YIG nuclease family protein [Pseudochryseolinea flava]